MLSCANVPRTFSKYLILSKINHSSSFNRPKRALYRIKYNGMTDINRNWTNLMRKMLCVWPQHASKHHNFEIQIPFYVSRTKYFSCDTDLCTSMYVHCLGYLYQMMKSAMGYTSTDNYTKPSYFRTNSVCQHNQNSKMCWHEPEQIRIFLLLPGYDAPLTHIQSTVLYSFHTL